MCWAQRQAEEAEWEEKQTEAALGAYANLQEHIFTLYTRLFPHYAWVDPTSAVAVMHREIERLRSAKETAMSSAKVKMAIARERDD